MSNFSLHFPKCTFPAKQYNVSHRFHQWFSGIVKAFIMRTCPLKICTNNMMWVTAPGLLWRWKQAPQLESANSVDCCSDNTRHSGVFSYKGRAKFVRTYRSLVIIRVEVTQVAQSTVSGAWCECTYHGCWTGHFMARCVQPQWRVC